MNGAFPAVKAFLGPLPAGADGVEFETQVPPSSGAPIHGMVQYWFAQNGSAQLVPGQPQFARISVRIRHVRYLGQRELSRGVDTAL
jgi:hypothetical protein